MERNRLNAIKTLLLILGSTILFSSCYKSDKTDNSALKLWCRQPENSAAIDKTNSWKSKPEWLKTFSLGNGSLGAMVFGDVSKDRILLNEKTMWSGSPNEKDNPVAYAKMNYSHKVRKEKQISPGNTTYYIDPERGDDKNPGLKENHAWRTFGHINQLQFSPGDRIEIMTPGSFDQTLMLKGDGTVENPVRVNFAEGRYDFFAENVYTGKYNISNTNSSPENGKAVGILIKQSKHFEITGAGAKIVYHGKMIEVCIDSCEDISISDLAFDYQRPTVSEYEVVDVTENHAEIKIHKDSEYKIEENKLIWVGEGWSHETGLAQELNLQTNEVQRMRDPLDGLEFEEVAPFVVRARGSHNLKSGMVYQLRDTFRDYAAVFTSRSKNISWTGVNFQFLHGMGLVSQFSENLTYKSVSIAPDSASGRTTAAWADCIHVSGCRGKLLVKDCIFSGAHDDAINIHGTYLRVVEQLTDKQIKVRFMHAQTYGFMAFNPGDEIEFVNRESLKSYGQNRVLEAILLNPKDLLLTLAEATPNQLKLEDVIENITWTPEVEVRGCQVNRIPTRGFLLSTRRKIVIEDNEFFRTHMSAILVAGDASNWYESGPVSDLTIRNNKFIDCGEPVIRIYPENSTPNNHFHQNILIENNEFVLRNELIVAAKSTNNLNITGNSIFSEKKLNDYVSIKLTDCSCVDIKQNSYLDIRD